MDIWLESCLCSHAFVSAFVYCMIRGEEAAGDDCPRPSGGMWHFAAGEAFYAAHGLRYSPWGVARPVASMKSRR